MLWESNKRTKLTINKSKQRTSLNKHRKHQNKLRQHPITLRKKAKRRNKLQRNPNQHKFLLGPKLQTPTNKPNIRQARVNIQPIKRRTNTIPSRKAPTLNPFQSKQLRPKQQLHKKNQKYLQKRYQLIRIALLSKSPRCYKQLPLRSCSKKVHFRRW